ncbi:PLP-dependent aminotransferase family protein [Chakrabartyella piscis]|uniref:aminotransferase-like domain-containing protein n=1 Tax=Chakrabartyella piscis TaxID=2918914 RepID=UPI002958CE71|nr:PLP-dependent aminotransferase family protein [Chakrabartyella piscis]
MSAFSKRVEYMKPSAIRESGKMIGAKPGCISFAGGLPSPDLMPLDAMRDISARVLDEAGTNALQYGLTRGYKGLVEEIVKMLAKKDIVCEPKNIQVTTGSQQGIFLTAMLMIDEGDAIVVENPTYLGALTSFAPLGCRYVDVDADDDGMLLEQLEAKLQVEKNVKMVYVVPNFSNPTGKEWSLERRKGLLALAEKYDLMIIEDDPYGDIRYEGEVLPSMKSMDTNGRVIYLGSFSKVLYAGLRVGFTVAEESIVDTFELFKQGIDLQSNEFAQNQIACFLQNYDLDAQIQSIVDNYKEKRDLMLTILDEEFPKSVKRTSPKGGMFVWVELPEGVDTFALLPQCIAEANVGYVPGGPFYAVEEQKNTMRLNFSNVDKEAIVIGMKALAKFLHKVL